MSIIMLFLIIGAMTCAVLEALGKCPGWVATILLCVAVALFVLPKAGF